MSHGSNVVPLTVIICSNVSKSYVFFSSIFPRIFQIDFRQISRFFLCNEFFLFHSLISIMIKLIVIFNINRRIYLKSLLNQVKVLCILLLIVFISARNYISPRFPSSLSLFILKRVFSVVLLK